MLPHSARSRQAVRAPASARNATLALALVAVLACVLLAGGAPRAAAASPPSCTTRGLVIWLDTQGSGAAGSTFYTVELTNLSGRTCTLSGYPRVVGVDLAGRQLGSASTRFVSQRALVTLANRSTASFVLQITEVGNFPASACRQVTAAGLRVFLPLQSASKVIPFPFQACSRSGPAYLSAQAVQPHA